MVLPLLCGGRKRQLGTERVYGNGKQERDGKAVKARQWRITRLKEIHCKRLTTSRLGNCSIFGRRRIKVGTLSNGTVENYLGAIRCIKKHPVADRKLRTVTAEHLQTFLDLLTFGGTYPDGKVKKGLSKDYIHSFSAVYSSRSVLRYSRSN